MEALQSMSSTHYVFQSGIVVIGQDILMDLKGLSDTIRNEYFSVKS